MRTPRRLVGSGTRRIDAPFSLVEPLRRTATRMDTQEACDKPRCRVSAAARRSMQEAGLEARLDQCPV